MKAAMIMTRAKHKTCQNDSSLVWNDMAATSLPLPILPALEQLGLGVESTPHFVPVRNGCLNKELTDRSIDLLRVVRGPDSHKNGVSIGFVGRRSMLGNDIVVGGLADKRVHPGGHSVINILLSGAS